MLWSADAADELCSRCRRHSAAGQGTVMRFREGRAQRRTAVRSQVRVDGAVPWSWLKALEGGAAKSLSLLAALKPPSQWLQGMFAINGRSACIRCPGHSLSMPLSPPQVRLVSNALLMHIQCRYSASAVQL